MKKNGFTLIELMIVVTIIGLLAAIAIPRFANITEDAKVAKVQGNLANLRVAAKMYRVKTDNIQGKDMFVANTSDVTDDFFKEAYSKKQVPKIPLGENVDKDKNRILFGDVTGLEDDSWDYPSRAMYYNYFVLVDGDGITPYGECEYLDIYAHLPYNAYGKDIKWNEY